MDECLLFLFIASYAQCICDYLLLTLQQPGNLIASLGAEVIIENSCFYGTSLLGAAGVPILLGGDFGTPKFTGINNFVDGTQGCNFVGELVSGPGEPLNVSCGAIADATECQSSLVDFVGF